jgi:hypothetical protein
MSAALLLLVLTVVMNNVNVGYARRYCSDYVRMVVSVRLQLYPYGGQEKLKKRGMF